MARQSIVDGRAIRLRTRYGTGMAVPPRWLRNSVGRATLGGMGTPKQVPDDATRVADLTARVKRLKRQVADLRRGLDKLEAEWAVSAATAAKS